MTGYGVALSGAAVAHPGFAAALCAAAATWVIGGRADVLRRCRLLLGPPDRAQDRGAGRLIRTWAPVAAVRRWAVGRIGPEWWCPVAGAALAVPGRSPLPLIAGVVALVPVRRQLRVRERRRTAERREAAVIELCASVAGELRAGQQPEQALLAAGTHGLDEAVPAVLAAARFAGDVPAALRRAAERPGADGLRAAAACWQVARDGGAGLADGLDRVAAALAAERDQREELQAQLAGPRATALVLALLPLFGLLLGSAMGARPLEVLLHTPAGLLCLLLGGLLEWAGLAWVARIVQSARQVEGEAER